MGILIAKFRKKTSALDVLTSLENEIVSIEDFQKRTRQTQRKIVFRFLLLAILIYATLVLLLYIYFSEISRNQRLIWSFPLIAVPLVIWLIKQFLTWYYNRKLKRNEKKLLTLKEKKKKILENVKETETYKVAKEILDKFGNEPKRAVISTPNIPARTPFVMTITTSPRESAFALRQRNLAVMAGRTSYGGAPNTPVPSPSRQLALSTPGAIRPRSSGSLAITSAMRPPLPRNILPRERSVLDKMVEYLVGDGPSNRYALICSTCSRHNGMAVKEEFEYLAFECCYCGNFNPARKQRPAAPTFNSPLMLTPAGATSTRAESLNDFNSNDDSDSESDEPIVEEPRSDSPNTPRTSDNERVSESELQNDNSKMDVDGADNNPFTAKAANVAESGDAVEVVEDVSDN